MKIFLIGFMGCGKSTLGKKLASRMGYEFIDLDHQIEREIGSTIASYFSAHGEAVFRSQESKTLKEFDYPENCVVATGGGTPCFFDNMKWINSNGLSIYIELPPVVLAQRLESGKDKRPLLKDLNGEALVAFIADKLAERSDYYQQCQFTISGISLTADALKSLLLARE